MSGITYYLLLNLMVVLLLQSYSYSLDAGFLDKYTNCTLPLERIDINYTIPDDVLQCEEHITECCCCCWFSCSYPLSPLFPTFSKGELFIRNLQYYFNYGCKSELVNTAARHELLANILNLLPYGSTKIGCILRLIYVLFWYPLYYYESWALPYLLW
jgi:hypothetical protein